MASSSPTCGWKGMRLAPVQRSHCPCRDAHRTRPDHDCSSRRLVKLPPHETRSAPAGRGRRRLMGRRRLRGISHIHAEAPEPAHRPLRRGWLRCGPRWALSLRRGLAARGKQHEPRSIPGTCILEALAGGELPAKRMNLYAIVHVLARRVRIPVQCLGNQPRQVLRLYVGGDLEVPHPGLALPLDCDDHPLHDRLLGCSGRRPAWPLPHRRLHASARPAHPPPTSQLGAALGSCLPMWPQGLARTSLLPGRRSAAPQPRHLPWPRAKPLPTVAWRRWPSRRAMACWWRSGSPWHWGSLSA